MAKIPTIEQEYFYRAAPARVYRALTRPRELEKWFPKEAEVELQKGGAFRLRWSKTSVMRGRVREVVAGRRLVVDWHDRFDGKTFDTRATFELRKRGRGTTLSIRHGGFKSGKSWIRLYGAIESGWAFYLLNLRSVLEHGTDLRSPSDMG